MKILNIYNKPVQVNLKKYRVDWDRKVSGPQKLVKDSLRNSWKSDLVFEEYLIPNSKLRIDLLNLTKQIAVEISPNHHFEYNKFFHKNRSNFGNVVMNDYAKLQWAEANGFTFIELLDEDLKDFTLEKFKSKL